MAKNNNGDWYEKFGEAFRDVAGPEFERINNRLGKVEEDVADLKGSADRIERKLDANMERSDRHGKRLDDHEERSTSLESA